MPFLDMDIGFGGYWDGVLYFFEPIPGKWGGVFYPTKTFSESHFSSFAIQFFGRREGSTLREDYINYVLLSTRTAGMENRLEYVSSIPDPLTATCIVYEFIARHQDGES